MLLNIFVLLIALFPTLIHAMPMENDLDGFDVLNWNLDLSDPAALMPIDDLEDRELEIPVVDLINDIRLENDLNDYNQELMPLNLSEFEQSSSLESAQPSSLTQFEDLNNDEDWLSPLWKNIQQSGSRMFNKPNDGVYQKFWNQNSMPILSSPPRPRHRFTPVQPQHDTHMEEYDDSFLPLFGGKSLEPIKLRPSDNDDGLRRSRRPIKKRTFSVEDSDEETPKQERTNDLLLRHEVLKSSGKEKLELMLEINRSLPHTSTMTSEARDFASRQLKPVMVCLKNHHGGDVESFIKRWGKNFFTSQFANKCCDGSGDACLTKYQIRKKTRKNDFDGRHELQYIKDPREKLERMVELGQECPRDMSTLTGNAKDFVYMRLRPVLRCFNEHFHGDKDEFLKFWHGRFFPKRHKYFCQQTCSSATEKHKQSPDEPKIAQL